MASYTAPVYDEKKYRQGINSSFYDQAIKDYSAGAKADAKAQIQTAEKNRVSALKQAYINRVQNTNAMNDRLQQAGIRGGMTETANLNIANQYGQARQAANSDYQNSVNQINLATNQNIRDYTADMKSRKEEYIQNQANARWQAAREDSLNQYNSAVEYWNNYYLDLFSGKSKKEAQKQYKKADDALKKGGLSAAEQIRYEQMKRGAGNRLGVIANK